MKVTPTKGWNETEVQGGKNGVMVDHNMVRLDLPRMSEVVIDFCLYSFHCTSLQRRSRRCALERRYRSIMKCVDICFFRTY